LPYLELIFTTASVRTLTIMFVKRAAALDKLEAKPKNGSWKTGMREVEELGRLLGARTYSWLDGHWRLIVTIRARSRNWVKL
jgi:hypothetical protein